MEVSDPNTSSEPCSPLAEKLGEDGSVLGQEENDTHQSPSKNSVPSDDSNQITDLIDSEQQSNDSEDKQPNEQDSSEQFENIDSEPSGENEAFSKNEAAKDNEFQSVSETTPDQIESNIAHEESSEDSANLASDTKIFKSSPSVSDHCSDDDENSVSVNQDDFRNPPEAMDADHSETVAASDPDATLQKDSTEDQPIEKQSIDDTIQNHSEESVNNTSPETEEDMDTTPPQEDSSSNLASIQVINCRTIDPASEESPNCASPGNQSGEGSSCDTKDGSEIKFEPISSPVPSPSLESDEATNSDNQAPQQFSGEANTRNSVDSIKSSNSNYGQDDNTNNSISQSDDHTNMSNQSADDAKPSANGSDTSNQSANGTEASSQSANGTDTSSQSAVKLENDDKQSSDGANGEKISTAHSPDDDNSDKVTDDDPISEMDVDSCVTSLPRGLQVAHSGGSGPPGVCTKSSLCQGHTYGPYNGEVVTIQDNEKGHSICLYVAFQSDPVPAAVQESGDWVQLVRCTTKTDQANLTCREIGGATFYVVTSDVPPGGQLLAQLGMEDPPKSPAQPMAPPEHVEHKKVSAKACSCGQTFTQICNLNTHVKIKNQDNKYHCTFCFKSFPFASGLAYHVRRHTGEKPFSCEVCNKRFSHQQGVKSHMKTHYRHDGKLYNCNYCGKGYSNERTFKAHIKMCGSYQMQKYSSFVNMNTGPANFPN